MNYYNEIRNELVNNELTKRVKTYSINRSDLTTYYNVGKLLSEAGKHYGEGIIKEYSKRLTSELGKGYNTTNLKRFRQFYEMVEKGATMWHQLSWSQIRLLLSFEINKCNYYINSCLNNNLSVRQLQDCIKSNEYERLPEDTKKKLDSNTKSSLVDFVKDPIIIKSNNRIDDISEKALHLLILEDIPSFLKELGSGFTFIDHEYKIKFNDRYNYIDFLLFNIDFNCYVVVEIKITELKKEHIGQIQTYINYIDKNIKKITHDNTIGIIICKKDNNYVIEYSSDSRIIARKYELI